MHILTCANHRDLRWSCTERSSRAMGYHVHHGLVFLGFYTPYLADGPYTMRRPNREHAGTDYAYECLCSVRDLILAPEDGADGTERSTD